MDPAASTTERGAELCFLCGMDRTACDYSYATTVYHETIKSESENSSLGKNERTSSIHLLSAVVVVTAFLGSWKVIKLVQKSDDV